MHKGTAAKKKKIIKGRNHRLDISGCGPHQPNSNTLFPRPPTVKRIIKYALISRLHFSELGGWPLIFNSRFIRYEPRAKLVAFMRTIRENCPRETRELFYSVK